MHTTLPAGDSSIARSAWAGGSASAAGISRTVTAGPASVPEPGAIWRTAPER